MPLALFQTGILSCVSCVEGVGDCGPGSVGGRLSSLQTCGRFLVDSKYRARVTVLGGSFVGVRIRCTGPYAIRRGSIRTFQRELLRNNGGHSFTVIALCACANVHQSRYIGLGLRRMSLITGRVCVINGNSGCHAMCLGSGAMRTVHRCLGIHGSRDPCLFIDHRSSEVTTSEVGRVFGRCSSVVAPGVLHRCFYDRTLSANSCHVRRITGRTNRDGIRAALVCDGPSTGRVGRGTGGL